MAAGGFDCKKDSGKITASWRRPVRMAGDRIWAPNLLHVASPHAPCRAGQRPARPHSWLQFLPVEGQVSQKTGEHPPKTNQPNLCFLSPCPNRSLISFPSCKIPSLAFPIAKPPHADPQNLPRDRERALCSRPWAPWASFVSRHRPRTSTPCCFSHTVLQWAFFHSTIDGPTAFISRN